jgi:hypothetical protein
MSGVARGRVVLHLARLASLATCNQRRPIRRRTENVRGYLGMSRLTI